MKRLAEYLQDCAEFEKLGYRLVELETLLKIEDVAIRYNEVTDENRYKELLAEKYKVAFRHNELERRILQFEVDELLES